MDITLISDHAILSHLASATGNFLLIVLSFGISNPCDLLSDQSRLDCNLWVRRGDERAGEIERERVREGREGGEKK